MGIAYVFGSGLVGMEMAAALHRSHHYDVRMVRRADCDIADSKSVDQWCRLAGPGIDVIVNAAGYTDVDKAEDEPELAYRVNGLGAENLRKLASSINVRFVHISSDAVFGRWAQSYDELDAPYPVNVYGRTKLAGEALIERVHTTLGHHMEGDQPLVIRTGNLYGRHGKNHASRLARPLAEPTPVDCDRCVAPTPGWLVAETVVKLLRAGESGLYHVMTTGRTSWYDFATRAQEWQLQAPGLAKPRHGKYGQAPRSPYGLLHSVLLPLRGIAMPPWQDALREHLSREAAHGAAAVCERENAKAAR
jgi:dTDP-4-dehydrorhamnose reductase